MLSPMRGDARYTQMTKIALTKPKSEVREITINVTQQGTSSHRDEWAGTHRRAEQRLGGTPPAWRWWY